MPDAATLTAYYDREAWFEGGERGGYVNYDDQTAHLLPFFEGILDAFGARGDGRSVLDVGCGYGSHLAIAHERGWKCFGIEVSDHARRVIAERYGRSMFVVDSAEHLIPHEFDLIVMLDVLEHLPDPYDTFYTLFAKGAITPKTKVVIGTPNARSAEAIADPAGWVFRHPPSHLVYFSAESLTRLLSTLRFNSIDVRGLFESRVEREPAGYENERSPLNEKLSAFAGLLCEASGSDFVEFMRERYVPGTWSRLAAYEHVPRYLFARNLARGVRALDFGCGTGYGTAILAEAAKSVVGVDIDASALEWARSHHTAANISFDHRDDLGAGLAAGSFDLIACFEMIEHVPEELQVKTIESFARLVTDKGIAVISTPNPEITKLYGSNPYHLREMTEAEFTELLRTHFPYVKLLYQRLQPSILISSSSAEAQRLSTDGLTWHDAPNLSYEPAVFLALCSKSPLPELEGRCYFDFHADYIAEQLDWERRVNTAEFARFSADEHATTLEAQVATTTRDLGAEVERRGAALAEQAATIEAMHRDFQQQASNIEGLHCELEERCRALARQTERSTMLEKTVAALQDESDAIKHAAIAAERKAEHLSVQVREEQLMLHAAEQKAEHLSTLVREEELMLHAAEQKAEYMSTLVREEELALRAAEQKVVHLAALVQAKESTLHSVLSSRWMQLGNALNERPVSVNSLKRALHLGASIVLPAAVKRMLKPLIQRRPAVTPSASRAADLEPALTPSASRAADLEPAVTPSASRAADLEPYVVRMPNPAREPRPRILHAIANFMTGGSSRLVVDLIEHLGQDYDQHVLTSYNPDPACYLNVPISELRQGTSAEEISRLICRLAPDLVHVHYWGECDEPWYDAVFRAVNATSARVIENVNTPVTPYRSPRVERYVFVSDYVERAFGTGLESQSLRIYPGSDFQTFDREAHGDAPGDCIGMVYRLETDKLNEASIQPFIKAVQRRPSTQVLIIGGGSLLDPFRKAVDAAGVSNAFTFSGYVSYHLLPSLYARMSIFVAPVWKESFGQVAPFAMSMGIPVVGYGVGAIPEIVGDPGLCAPSGDSAHLAEIIVHLLDDRARRLEIGRRNRERAHRQFSVEAMIDRYGQLYAQLLEVRA